MVLLPIKLDDLINRLTTSITEKVITTLTAKEKSENAEKLISISEVCKLFVPTISRQTVLNWEAKGLLERKVIGGKPCFRQGDVLEAAKSLKKYKRG